MITAALIAATQDTGDGHRLPRGDPASHGVPPARCSHADSRDTARYPERLCLPHPALGARSKRRCSPPPTPIVRPGDLPRGAAGDDIGARRPCSAAAGVRFFTSPAELCAAARATEGSPARALTVMLGQRSRHCAKRRCCSQSLEQVDGLFARQDGRSKCGRPPPLGLTARPRSSYAAHRRHPAVCRGAAARRRDRAAAARASPSLACRRRIATAERPASLRPCQIAPSRTSCVRHAPSIAVSTQHAAGRLGSLRYLRP